MGIKNYLIDGVSGVGKTTVAEELERRGYHVVHGDRVLAYYGDPETGEPLDWPAHMSEADAVAWGTRHWVWPVDKVKALIADRGHPMSFFCGGSRNSHQFIDLFDQIFILEIDLDTLHRRLARRPDDEFGGKPIERELAARMHATRAGIPKRGVIIDATAPLAQVVDTILENCISATAQPPET